MKYKIVACDVDGTLLRSDGTLSKLNIEMIKKIEDLGVRFIITTGRSDVLVEGLVDKLGIDGTVIGCNGASVRDIVHDELFVLEVIEDSALKELFDYFEENDVCYSCFTMEKCYSTIKSVKRRDEIQQKYFRVKKNEDLESVVLDTMYSLFEMDLQIIKVCVFAENGEEALKVQTVINDFSGIEAIRPVAFVLDIVKDGVSKGNALKKYAEGMGISQSEVIAMGDGENDLSMLQYAGLAVGMKNGADAIFKYTDMVTDTNDNDGVGKALIEIFSL